MVPVCYSSGTRAGTNLGFDGLELMGKKACKAVAAVQPAPEQAKGEKLSLALPGSTVAGGVYKQTSVPFTSKSWGTKKSVQVVGNQRLISSTSSPLYRLAVTLAVAVELVSQKLMKPLYWAAVVPNTLY